MGERRTRGEGSLYQRKSDGRWIGVVDRGWVGGKRVRQTVSAPTLKELRPKFKALKQQAEAGVLSDDATVEMWINHWLDEIAAKRVRESTLRTYRGYAATWIVPHLGRRRLDKLRPEHVRALHRAMEDAGKSDATRRQVHAILSRALKVAEREQRIASNPAAKVDPPPVGKGSHGWLTLPEARKVLAQLDESEASTSRWACALLAGLRQGEALGLTWEHVNLERRVIRVRQAAQRVKGKGVIVVGLKTKSAERDIFMVDPVYEALKARAAETGREGFVWGGDKPSDPRKDWQEWHDLLDDAGVAPRPLHAARATTGSLLLEAGVSETLVKEILGHAQVMVTQRHYLHGSADQHERAMTSMADLLALD